MAHSIQDRGANVPLWVVLEGARFTCSQSQSPRDALVGFLSGSFLLSLC